MYLQKNVGQEGRKIVTIANAKYIIVEILTWPDKSAPRDDAARRHCKVLGKIGWSRIATLYYALSL